MQKPACDLPAFPSVLKIRILRFFGAYLIKGRCERGTGGLQSHRDVFTNHVQAKSSGNEEPIASFIYIILKVVVFY